MKMEISLADIEFKGKKMAKGYISFMMEANTKVNGKGLFNL